MVFMPIDYVGLIRNRKPTPNEYIRMSNCIEELRKIAIEKNKPIMISTPEDAGDDNVIYLKILKNRKS